MADILKLKERPKGFLRNEVISHDSEAFDYITELHQILWRFVNAEIPGVSGDLKHYLPTALHRAESRAQQ